MIHILDMVVKYRQERRDNGSDLQDDEIQRLTDIVTGLRKQWERIPEDSEEENRFLALKLINLSILGFEVLKFSRLLKQDR